MANRQVELLKDNIRKVFFGDPHAVDLLLVGLIGRGHVLIEDVPGVGKTVLARSLARSGALREGVRERDAADVIHALASPEVYGLLVLDRGWSGERYERWMAETLSQQLVG